MDNRLLDKYDDFYIHQQKKSIIEVEESDPAWFERCYISIHDPEGKFLMNCGLGAQPNAGTMDGFTSVVIGEKQRNIRLFRHIHNDRAVMHIGPLQFDILEPMERWRLQLKENDYGISYDIEFKKRGSIYQYKPILQDRTDGPQMVWMHFVQVPEFNGTLTVDGKKYDVRKCGYFRDRSWGTRRLGLYGLYWLNYVPFPDYCLYLTHIENIDNSILFSGGALLYNDGRVVEIVGVRHTFEFEPGTLRHVKAEYEIICEDGRKISLTSKKVAQGPLIYGGGYCWQHGMDAGEYHVESEDWNINDEQFLKMPTDVYDQLVEYDDGKEKARGLLELGVLNAGAKYRATL